MDGKVGGVKDGVVGGLSAWHRGALLACVPVFLLVVFSFKSYSGSAWVLLLFHVSFFSMLGLACKKPVVDGVFFLSLFLFLGFWLKFMVHLLIDYDFVEPVGRFDGSAVSWDRVLSVGALAALGVAAFKLISMRLARLPIKSENSLRPAWYTNQAAVVWGGLAVVAVVIYSTNFFFSFFQIGIDQKIDLPFGLNSAISWLVYCGYILSFLMVWEWALREAPSKLWLLMCIVCTLGVTVSVSTVSRSTMIFIFLALCAFIIFDRSSVVWANLKARRWLIFFILALSLVMSLFLVSWARLYLYELPVEAPQHETTSRGFLMFKQVLKLGVDRWIGLEGVMVVTGVERSHALFWDAIVENPTVGVDAYYQQVANSAYARLEGFTFLTIPGVTAILYYSGSFFLVFIGMFLCALVLWLIEYLARFWMGRLAACWIGVLAANAICQMNFPKLALIFLLLSCVAISCFGVLLGLFDRYWSSRLSLKV